MHISHPELPLNELWAGKPRFKREQHCITYLSQSVAHVSGLRGNQMTPIQATAFKRYRSKAIFSIRSNVKEVSDQKILNAYFDLFDSLFFFGSMKGKCKARISSKGTKESGRNGVAIKDDMGGGIMGTVVEIVIYSRDVSGRSERLLKYLGTLLHEMIHAFYYLWACQRRECLCVHGPSS